MIGTSRRQHEVRALVLRRTNYGESDLILTFLSHTLGKLDAVARAARKSQKRYSGGLEPFHTLDLSIDEPTQGGLFFLRETRLMVPRLSLVGHLRAMTVAGRGLGWLRRALPTRVAEPLVFEAVERWLDYLEAHPTDNTLEAEARLGEFGIGLLEMLGWALEFDRCVRCGRVCPEDKSATLDPRRGGLVCRNCGGGPVHLSAPLRARLRAQRQGSLGKLEPSDAPLVLDIVEETLKLHPGVRTD